MKIGTKSVLFGVHCWAIHPWFVAWAWWKLYGFPFDPLLWVAFFVHDLGYFGKPNMDGKEGETHVEFGAKVMHWLFDKGIAGYEWHEWSHPGKGVPWRVDEVGYGKMLTDGWTVEWHFADYPGFTLLRRAVPVSTWRDFCLYHSRYYAKKSGRPFSRLCVADKLAIAITPAWLYLPLANLSGEIHEYMALAKKRAEANEALNKYERMELTSDDQRRWYEGVQAYMVRWVDEHKDCRADKWTATTWKARP